VANPTTNYGFVLPTPTDLVTDLPADFDVALQGVDTRLKALQPGTTLGDLAYSSATANTNTRLPIGTSGQVLAVSGGGVPAWTTTADVTPLTTKGDLFTFTTADARLGVGANGTILTADSAEATGLKWAAPTSGLTLVKRSSFSAVATTTTTFDSVFTTTYAQYMIVIENMFCSSGGQTAYFQWREAGSTKAGGSYFGAAFGYAAGSPPGLTTININGTQGSLSYMGTTAIAGLSMNLNAAQVGVSGRPQLFGNGMDSVNNLQINTGFLYNITIAADGFILSASAGNITGTVAIYGLAK
jgi:hypothetical protein